MNRIKNFYRKNRKRWYLTGIDALLPSFHSLLARIERGQSIGSRAVDSAWSVRRLNSLAGGMDSCTTYLEIGVSRGTTFRSVQVPFKWGVDPNPRFSTRKLEQGERLSVLESDTFFRSLDQSTKFNLVFVDGLHEWRQTYRDIINALQYGTLSQILLIDDVTPRDSFSAIPDQNEALNQRWKTGDFNSQWQGDVYKTLYVIKNIHPEIEFKILHNGGDNDQAIMWLRKGQGLKIPSGREYDSVVDRAERLTYQDAFDSFGHPRLWEVDRELNGIAIALQESNAKH